MVCVLCVLYVHEYTEDSQYVTTLLQSYSKWQPLTGEMLVPRIPFGPEGLCPGMIADFQMIMEN